MEIFVDEASIDLSDWPKGSHEVDKWRGDKYFTQSFLRADLSKSAWAIWGNIQKETVSSDRNWNQDVTAWSEETLSHQLLLGPLSDELSLRSCWWKGIRGFFEIC